LFVDLKVTTVWDVKIHKKALIEFRLFCILKSCFCPLGWFVSLVWSKFALHCLADLQLKTQISKFSLGFSP
jgi:hypothetical protein